MKKRLIKIWCVFFLGIVLLTILSRVSASLSVPKVEMETPKRMQISHRIEAQAQVLPACTTPVLITEGLFIDEICVVEGQTVEKEQSLIKVNQKMVQKQLELCNNELKQLELQIQGVQNVEEYNEKAYNQEVQSNKERLQLIIQYTNQQVDIAKKEMEKAQAAYDSFVENGSNGEEEADDTLVGLKQEKEAKEKEYYDALQSRKLQVMEAENTLKQAEIPKTEDTTIDQLRLQQSILKTNIQEYNQLINNQYRVLSPVSGIVSEILIDIGQTTPMTASFLIADTTQDYKTVFQESIENAKYLYPGATVNVKGINPELQGIEQDLKIQSTRIITKDEQQCIEATIYLPAGQFSLSSFVEIALEQKSEYYDYGVPVYALNQDGEGTFVYIAEQKDTTLGKEWIARKLYIQIADQNEQYCAIEPGTLTSNMKVIVQSDQELTEGCEVREKWLD